MLSTDAHRRAILEAFATPAGYEIKPRRKLTDAERLARLEEALRSKLGAVGESLLAEVGR